MAIREKTPRERAAMQFRAAGLGDRSAVEAARLMFDNGLPFESAAVLGQRLAEASTATPASIRAAAGRYRRTVEGPCTTTAWGRPVPVAAAEKPSPSRSGPIVHPESTRVIDGVLHHEVVEYEPVTEQEEPTRSAWGRKLED
jgi:hypothetical protein